MESIIDLGISTYNGDVSEQTFRTEFVKFVNAYGSSDNYFVFNSQRWMYAAIWAGIFDRFVEAAINDHYVIPAEVRFSKYGDSFYFSSDEDQNLLLLPASLNFPSRVMNVKTCGNFVLVPQNKICSKDTKIELFASCPNEFNLKQIVDGVVESTISTIEEEIAFLQQYTTKNSYNSGNKQIKIVVEGSGIGGISTYTRRFAVGLLD